MTMDIKQSRMNVKITPSASDHHEHHQLHHVASKMAAAAAVAAAASAADRKPPTSGTKRSFDVAFLMLPDEKLAAARHGRTPKRQPPPAPPSPTIDVESDSTQSEDLSLKGGFSPIQSPDNERPFHLDVLAGVTARHPMPLAHHHQHHPHHHPQHHPALAHHPALVHAPTGPPGGEERLAYLFAPGARFYEHPFGAFGRGQDGVEPPRSSAFQKVATTESPLPPLSPDRHSCPSTSPPVSLSPSGSQTGGFRPYEYGPFLSPSPGSPPAGPPGPSPRANSPAPKPQPVLPMLYRGHPPSAEPTDGPPTPYFPGVPPFGLPPFGAGGPTSHTTPESVDGIMRNPAAAAILSTLLPSAMSTFTLSAQNVCAKCNISFRMTSDLVYHMRSHHKSEHVHDHARRKREDKLKCPVCNESFRERHHLTRHMTAHQDKAGDLLEKATPPGSAHKGSPSASSRHQQHHHQQQQQQQQQQQHHHHQQQQPHQHLHASPAGGRLS